MVYVAAYAIGHTVWLICLSGLQYNSISLCKSVPRFASNIPPTAESMLNTWFELQDQDMPTRSRIWRRRGKARKLKYTWKSAGHPFLRKRIADGKHQSCKQYAPCGCQQMCGKECPCQLNGTCCEKYCGYVIYYLAHCCHQMLLNLRHYLSFIYFVKFIGHFYF